MTPRNVCVPLLAPDMRRCGPPDIHSRQHLFDTVEWTHSRCAHTSTATLNERSMSKFEINGAKPRRFCYAIDGPPCSRRDLRNQRDMMWLFPGEDRKAFLQSVSQGQKSTIARRIQINSPCWRFPNSRIPDAPASQCSFTLERTTLSACEDKMSKRGCCGRWRDV